MSDPDRDDFWSRADDAYERARDERLEADGEKLEAMVRQVVGDTPPEYLRRGLRAMIAEQMRAAGRTA